MANTVLEMDYPVVSEGTSGQRMPAWMPAIALASTDLVSVVLAAAAALLLGSRLIGDLLPFSPFTLSLQSLDALWWIPMIILLYIALCDLYTKRFAFWRETRRLVGTLTLAFITILTVIAFGKVEGVFPQGLFLLMYFFTLITIPVGRLLVKSALSHTGMWNEPVLIMGGGPVGQQIAAALEKEAHLGYRVIGFLEDDAIKEGAAAGRKDGKYLFLGKFSDAQEVIRSTGVSHIIVAAPDIPGTELVRIAAGLQYLVKTITVVPDLIGFPVLGVEADYLFDEQILAFRSCNNLANPMNVLMKKIFDCVLSLLLMIPLAPLLMLISLLIKIESPGPAIFQHTRVGRGGTEFKVFKFRSMVNNAEAVLQDVLNKDPALKEEWERDFKLKNDPRVTRIGAFLRKTSLDELPQILNVLMGQMSLVGSRPIVRDEVERFGPYIHDYYQVSPGMTGLWQVSGRSDIDYAERVRMEAWYVRNWSLWLDITILLRTVKVVLNHRGAY